MQLFFQPNTTGPVAAEPVLVSGSGEVFLAEIPGKFFYQWTLEHPPDITCKKNECKKKK